MDNPGEILRLCRLCLVKDQVNIPIFEEQGDIRQIFLKISSCLPVKVSLEDKLPKKICDGCSNKLDLLYEFWNTSANAEKTLLSWLGQAGVKDADETISAVAQQIAKPAETQVKQEALDDGHAANQVQDNFGVQSFEEEAKDESEAPPPKRARRTAAVKAQINLTPESDDDDDMDSAEAMTKVEDESDESDGEDKDPSYGEIPGTSADDQAGPSGVGKDGVEAPSVKEIVLSNINKTADKTNDKDIVQKAFKNPNMSTNAKKDKKVNEAENKTRQITKSAENDKGTKNLVKKLFCNKCGELFKNFEDLLRHIFQPRKTKHSFRCICCRSNVGKTIIDLCEHVKDICGFLNIKKHEKIIAENFPKQNRYFCEICGRGYTTLHSLLGHQKQHVNSLLCCSICPEKSGSFAKLLNHSRRHTVTFNVNLTCQLCSLRFFSTTPYQLHYYWVHSKLIYIPFKCILCTQVIMDDEKSFLQHVQSHCKVTKEKDVPKNRQVGDLAEYTCEVCADIFESKKECSVHKIEKHNFKITKISRQCPLCPKILDINVITAHLNKHRKEKAKTVSKHTPPKPIGLKTSKIYKCLKCSRRFKRSFSLAQHELTHASINVEQTSMLKGKDLLNRRQQSSTSTSMPLSLNPSLLQSECHDCNRKFVSIQALNEHKKVHHTNSEKSRNTAKQLEDRSSVSKDTNLAINIHKNTSNKKIKYCYQSPLTFSQEKESNSSRILDKKTFLETRVREDHTDYHSRPLSPRGHRQSPSASMRCRSPTSFGHESDSHWTRTTYEGHDDRDEFMEGSSGIYLRKNSPHSRETYQDPHCPQESFVGAAYQHYKGEKQQNLIHPSTSRKRCRSESEEIQSYDNENQHMSRHSSISRKEFQFESEEFQNQVFGFKGQSIIQGSSSREGRSRSREPQDPNYDYEDQLNERYNQQTLSAASLRKPMSVSSREFQPPNYTTPSPDPLRKPWLIPPRPNYEYEDQVSNHGNRPSTSLSLSRKPGSISSIEFQPPNYEYKDQVSDRGDRPRPSSSLSRKPGLISKEFQSPNYDYGDQVSDRRVRPTFSPSPSRQLGSLLPMEFQPPNHDYGDKPSERRDRGTSPTPSRRPRSMSRDILYHNSNLGDRSSSRDSPPLMRKSGSKEYLPQEFTYDKRRFDRNDNVSLTREEYRRSSRDNSPSRDDRSFRDNRSRDNRSARGIRSSRDNSSSRDDRTFRDNRSSRDNRI